MWIVSLGVSSSSGGHELHSIDLQSISQAGDGDERDVALAGFDLLQVPPVQAGGVCQLHLREPVRSAEPRKVRAHASAELVEYLLALPPHGHVSSIVIS